MAAPLRLSLKLPPPLCIALSRSLFDTLPLLQAMVDQVACEHHTQTATELSRSSSSPFIRLLVIETINLLKVS